MILPVCKSKPDISGPSGTVIYRGPAVHEISQTNFGNNSKHNKMKNS